MKTRQVVCPVCSARTPMPVANPPFGAALICEKCQSPLVATLTRQGAPLATPAETLARLTGYTGRCLIAPCCAWCGEINYAIVAPGEGRSTPWHTQTGKGSGHAFSLDVKCTRCGKRFFVEWDEAPLQARCALCRTPLRGAARSSFDPRFCANCGAKVALVHARRTDAPPPGERVGRALLVGFGRVPGAPDVRRVKRRAPEVGDAPIGTLMASGGPPDTPVECALVAFQVAAAARARGGDVDPRKVTYQRVQDMLLVAVWA